MNRNAESRFALAPSLEGMSRSKFNRPQEIKTSFNAGDIIPFYVDEVLPGDTHSIDTSKVIRMQSLLTPIMDNIYLDTYYFFVPNRLVWDHWQEFCGENKKSAWIESVERSVPQIKSPTSTGFTVGTIADYFGIPTGIPDLSVSALPFRAYALIMNEWFRDQNLSDPLNIPTDDADQTGTNGSEYINDVANGGKPFKAAKYHDYFTSALPSPAKGPDVTISLGEQAVVGNGNTLGLTRGNDLFSLGTSNGGSTNAFFRSSIGEPVSTTITGNVYGNIIGNVGVPTEEQLKESGKPLSDSGLVTASGASLITIAQLRQAFQIQKFYEKSARGGTRYIEILKSMFGVTSPDARLQRPEYLGGNRLNININAVTQSSATGVTPQGNQAAYSLTTDKHSDFTRSFVEHGYIIGVMVARYDHTYQQGIEKFWSRKTKFQYYWPVFANLSEQPIRNKEIYAQGSNVINPATGKAYDDEVFGYQEAWAEYRYKPNRVSGEMRSQYAQSLDVWHLADDYNELPKLSDSWIREDKHNIDRTLAVTSSVSNQFFGDIYVKNETVRPMPVYSIPGLIDHH